MHSKVVAVLFALAAITNGLGYEGFVHETYMQGNGKDIQRERQKRGVIEKLLGQANLINKAGSYRQYSKLGGYQQAMRDFENLEPTDVIISKTSRRGQVGDTSVFMNQVMHRHVGYTVLTLTKNQVLPGGRSDLKIDTIRYFDVLE